MKEKLTLRNFNALIMVPEQIICNDVLPLNHVLDHFNTIALYYSYFNVINLSISSGIYFSTNNSCTNIISEMLTIEIFYAKSHSLMPDSANMINGRRSNEFGMIRRNISHYNQEITAQ